MNNDLKKPNMVITKLDDNLVSFQIMEDGSFSNGTIFESDYTITEHEIIMANYDSDKFTSVELYRATCTNTVTGTTIPITELYNNGQLLDFINKVLENNSLESESMQDEQ